MLYREIIATWSQIHTKHINTVCGQNVELLNVKLAVHAVTTELHCLLSLFHIKTVGVLSRKTENKLNSWLCNIGQTVCHLTCNSGRKAEQIFIKFNISAFYFSVYNSRFTSEKAMDVSISKAPLYAHAWISVAVCVFGGKNNFLNK